MSEEVCHAGLVCQLQHRGCGSSDGGSDGAIYLIDIGTFTSQLTER